MKRMSKWLLLAVFALTGAGFAGCHAEGDVGDHHHGASVDVDTK